MLPILLILLATTLLFMCIYLSKRVRHPVESLLQESEERFRLAIGAMSDGFVLQNEKAEIILCNRSAERILCLTGDQMRGRTTLHPDWRAVHEDGTPFPSDEHPALISLRDGVALNDVVMGIHKPQGALAWISINAAPLFRTGASRPHAVVVTFCDITERRWFEEQINRQIVELSAARIEMQQQAAALMQANMELERMNTLLASLAITDGLTGLQNHRAFQERLVEEFERAARYQIPLSLLLLDVDQFKRFNDSFGHPAGDRVLRDVARILRETARASDFVARYGGEEFAVLLCNTDLSAAIRAAERFRVAVESHLWDQRPITLSIGVAAVSAAVPDAAMLLSMADQALYTSKEKGRNRVTSF